MGSVVSDIVKQINKQRLLGLGSEDTVEYNGGKVSYAMLDNSVYFIQISHGIYSLDTEIDVSNFISDGVSIMVSGYNKVYGIRSDMRLLNINEAKIEQFCTIRVTLQHYTSAKLRCKDETAFIARGRFTGRSENDCVVISNIAREHDGILCMRHNGKYTLKVIDECTDGSIMVDSIGYRILKKMGYNPLELNIKDRGLMLS